MTTKVMEAPVTAPEPPGCNCHLGLAIKCPIHGMAQDQPQAMTLEEALRHTAVMLLSAARTIHDLATGVLERKEGPDRAARIAMLRGSDAIAFVAALTQDGLLGKEAEKELRESFPAFGIAHEELLGLHDALRAALAKWKERS